MTTDFNDAMAILCTPLPTCPHEGFKHISGGGGGLYMSSKVSSKQQTREQPKYSHKEALTRVATGAFSAMILILIRVTP